MTKKKHKNLLWNHQIEPNYTGILSVLEFPDSHHVLHKKKMAAITKIEIT
jgi:hypothetical protein